MSNLMGDTSYEVTDENRQELFQLLLDLLRVFDEVCRKNNIQYFADGGTALGAIRHKGFIPWDDDVDIAMLRGDYEKLKTVAAEGAFQSPYFFQNPATDEGYSKGFSRLRNSNSTEIPFMDYTMKCNHGVFIDIFPLDVVPDDDKLLQRQCAKLHRLRTIMNAYSRYYSGIGSEAASLPKKIGYSLSSLFFRLGFFSMDRVFNRFEKVEARYNSCDYKRLGTLTAFFEVKRFIFEKQWWDNPIRVAFEDTMIPVPKNVDAILSHKYGDYMRPVKQPTLHGNMFFASNVPYDEFIQNNGETLKRQWLKWYTSSDSVD